MEFRILGPLEVVDQGGNVKLGGSKQRSLLAFLLLSPNQAISRDRLIDALWGDPPPVTATTAIQVHVSQLRKRFALHDGIVAGLFCRIERRGKRGRVDRPHVQGKPPEFVRHFFRFSA